MYLVGEKNDAPTKAKSKKNELFIRHCSASGYIPYKNLLNQTFTKTQQAPPLVQSSLEFPKKPASKINQFNTGGTNLIKAKITSKVNAALILLELKLVFILSRDLPS